MTSKYKETKNSFEEEDQYSSDSEMSSGSETDSYSDSTSQQSFENDVMPITKHSSNPEDWFFEVAKKTKIKESHSSECVTTNVIKCVPRRNIPKIQNLCLGHVTGLDPDNRCGELAFSSSNIPYTLRVPFKFEDIYNESEFHVEIGFGSEVMFQLSSYMKNKYLIVQTEFIIINKRSIPNFKFEMRKNNEDDWHAGKVIVIKENKADIAAKNGVKFVYVIKPNDPFDYFKGGIVHMNDDKISKVQLPLIKEDWIAFCLKRTKSFQVSVAEVLHYTDRSEREICLFIADLRSKLNEYNLEDECLYRILNCNALWRILVNIANDNLNALNVIIKLLVKIFNKKTTHKQMKFEIILNNLKTNNFFSINSSFFNLIKKKEVIKENDVIFKFILHVVSLNHSFAEMIVPHLKLFLNKNVGKGNQKLVYEILKFVITGKIKSIEGHYHWNELRLVPDNEEIVQNILHNDDSLMPVRIGQGYEPEEYMDTYFKLLRTDCFYYIAKGISDFRNNSLDFRDVNIFGKCYIVGFRITIHHGLELIIECLLKDCLAKFGRSSCLLSGNLLGISASNHFDDTIWAIITDKNIDSSKCKIVVKLCSDLNDFGLKNSFANLLCNNSLLIIESPAYYNSFAPVLKALKKFDVEKFSLKKEIFEGKIYEDLELNIPKYILETTTIDSGIVLHDGHETSFSKFLKELRNSSLDCILDPSQKDALLHALVNKVAIIQGPPGCGKTFLSVLLIRIILSVKPAISGPILVLTYKNHALDELLKQVITFYGKDSVGRIGSMSKESCLENCNLRQLRGDSYANSKHIYYDFLQLKSKIESDLVNLNNNAQLTFEEIRNSFTEKQIQCFLLQANWSRIGEKITQKKIKKLLQEVGVSFIISPELGKYFSSNYHQNCVETLNLCFDSALGFWLPKKKKLEKYKKCQTGSFFSKNINLIKPQSNSNEIDDEVDDRDTVESIETGNTINFCTKNTTFNQIYCLSDFPFNIDVNNELFSTKNLWSLSEFERIQYIYSLIANGISNLKHDMYKNILELNKYESMKRALQSTSDARVLKSKKVIGMTITGACINNSLIMKMKPSIVIVEEAAEILEPNLVATLNKSIQHLIMIGDHRQLRPNVECYKLAEKYKFDISMMERLISCDFPYARLKLQNRMRPEIAKLLLDIYPNLLSNNIRVSQNKIPNCLVHSISFWNHDDPETGNRSYQNYGEADRAVSLTLFLLSSGVLPDKITLLSAYEGQTAILKKLLRKSAQKYPNLFWLNTNSELTLPVNVSTIDMFQGDENDVIIVSTVRSNVEKRLGFLNILNRRCVAQSRAKCALIILGNKDLLKNSSHWKNLLNNISKEELGLVASEMHIQCFKHLEKSIKVIKSSSDFIYYVDNPDKVCSLICNHKYECKIHFCKKYCFPHHDHYKCKSRVDDIFPECNHPVQRQCYQNVEHLKCQFLVEYNFSCGHSIQKECHTEPKMLKCVKIVDFVFKICKHHGRKECSKEQTEIKCEMACPISMDCNEHHCPKKCSDPHEKTSHNSSNCDVKVNFTYEKCKHKNVKQCNELEENILCKALVDFEFPSCRHKGTKKCFEGIKMLQCQQRLKSIRYCGHEIQKQCYELSENINCHFPCKKTKKCGHECLNRCSDECNDGYCKKCELQDLFFSREDANRQIQLLEMKQKREKNFEITPLDPDRHGSEYQTIEDRITKFVGSNSAVVLDVLQIYKIKNLKSEIKFQKYRQNSFGNFISKMFFKVCNKKQEKLFLQNGRIVSNNINSHLHFHIKPQISNNGNCSQLCLIYCDVIIGKYREIEFNDKINTKLLEGKYDSIKMKDNDQFAVFNHDQVLARYAIKLNLRELYPELKIANKKSYELFLWYPSRRVNSLNDSLEQHCRLAEAEYLKMKNLHNLDKNILKIQYILNKKFSKDKSEGVSAFCVSTESNALEVAAYNFKGKKKKVFHKSLTNEDLKKENCVLILSYIFGQQESIGNEIRVKEARFICPTFIIYLK